jgi:hypothetical protein
MIFTLAKEISSIENWSLDDVSSIEALAQSAFKGFHIVTIESPEVAEMLLAAPAGTFSAVTTAVVKKMLATYSFQGSLLSRGFACAMITTSSSVTNAVKRAEYVLTLEDIRGMSLEPTTILAENITDAKVYEISAKHYIASARLKGVCLAAVARGGGGSTIAAELKEIVDQGSKMCIVITDSDVAWPGCGQSETAKCCERLISKARIPTAHTSIQVRELENLIPTTVLKEIVVGDALLDSIQQLESLIELVPDVRILGDLKEGVNGAKVFRMSDDSPERCFHLGLLARNHPSGNHFIQSTKCAMESNEIDCSCMSIPKVGNVASRFHEWLSSRSHHKALESFASPWREAWLSVGATVLAWCCAQPPLRI